MKTAIKILCFLFCFGVLSAQAAEQYSGTYHGRRVIGKHLAEFCQIADDTVASDMKGLKECLEKLATKLRAGEPKVQEEGQKEYQEILTEQLVYLLGGGKSKNASAPNYEEDYNMSLKQAVHSEGSDIHTQETATAATTEKQMTSMLDAISLLYEKMKSEALNQVPLMNPDLKPVFPANGDMEKDSMKSGSKFYLKKLSASAQKRAPQAELVSEFIKENSNISTIVCGDFNDIPLSYTHYVISDGLTDCYQKRGRGFGFSYCHNAMRVRIDHILCSPDINPIKCWVDSDIKLSDHYPIISHCLLENKEKK
jgi:hypothetical protein